MSRAGDDAEQVMRAAHGVSNGRSLGNRDAQVFEFGTAPGSAVVKIPVQGG